MALIRALTGSSGGGGKTSWTFDPTGAETTATDANPIVINGDFSNVTGIMTYGAVYSSGGMFSTKLAQYNDVTIGTPVNVDCGTYSSVHSYRTITVKSDRIEIGKGYYGSQQGDSNYGVLLKLAVFTSTADY